MTTSVSLADTAARLSAFIDTQISRDDQLRNWTSGTIDGGPNGDGYYPLTDALGETVLLPSIPRLMAGLTGPDAIASLQQAQALINQANQVSTTASATLQSAQAILPDVTARRDEALNARNQAVAAAAAAEAAVTGTLDLSEVFESNLL
jgi:hypothetical protein